MGNWKETKKEFEITERGELMPTRVTMELESPWKFRPKELIDLGIRIIALLAIGIPIFLFYQGRHAELERQQELLRIDTYTKTSTELHYLHDKRLGSGAFNDSRDKLFNELYPKLLYLNDTAIVDTFKVVKDLINFYSLISEFLAVVDSIYSTFLRDAHLFYNPNDNAIFGKESPVSVDPSQYKKVIRQLTFIYPNMSKVDWKTETEKATKLIRKDSALFKNTRDSLYHYVGYLVRNSYSFDIRQKKDPIPLIRRVRDEVLKIEFKTKKTFSDNYREFLSSYTPKLDSMLVKGSMILNKKE